jgi:hypothetical protein
VLFAGGGERIEITHRSSSRANYAQGSLRAAASSPAARRASTAWRRCSASTHPAAGAGADRLRELLGPRATRSPAASRSCCWRCRSAPGS